jgi:hypothetical protein
MLENVLLEKENNDDFPSTYIYLAIPKHTESSPQAVLSAAKVHDARSDAVLTLVASMSVGLNIEAATLPRPPGPADMGPGLVQLFVPLPSPPGGPPLSKNVAATALISPFRLTDDSPQPQTNFRPDDSHGACARPHASGTRVPLTAGVLRTGPQLGHFLRCSKLGAKSARDARTATFKQATTDARHVANRLAGLCPDTRPVKPT